MIYFNFYHVTLLKQYVFQSGFGPNLSTDTSIADLSAAMVDINILLNRLEKNGMQSSTRLHNGAPRVQHLHFSWYTHITENTRQHFVLNNSASLTQCLVVFRQHIAWHLLLGIQKKIRFYPRVLFAVDLSSNASKKQDRNCH